MMTSLTHCKLELLICLLFPMVATRINKDGISLWCGLQPFQVPFQSGSILEILLMVQRLPNHRFLILGCSNLVQYQEWSLSYKLLGMNSLFCNRKQKKCLSQTNAEYGLAECPTWGYATTGGKGFEVSLPQYIQRKTCLHQEAHQGAKNSWYIHSTSCSNSLGTRPFAVPRLLQQRICLTCELRFPLWIYY